MNSSEDLWSIIVLGLEHTHEPEPRSSVEVARVAAAMNTERIELAPEPGYGDVTWVSAYEVDPFSVPAKDKVDLLAAWSADLAAVYRRDLRADSADHAEQLRRAFGCR